MEENSRPVENNQSSTRSTSSYDDPGPSTSTHTQSSSSLLPDDSKRALQRIVDRATPDEVTELYRIFDALSAAEQKISAHYEGIALEQSVRLGEAVDVMTKLETTLDSAIEMLESSVAGNERFRIAAAELREENRELRATIAREENEKGEIKKKYESLIGRVDFVTEELKDFTGAMETCSIDDGEDDSVVNDECPEAKLEKLSEFVKSKFLEWTHSPAALKEEVVEIRKVAEHLAGVLESNKLQSDSTSDENKADEKPENGLASQQESQQISDHVGIQADFMEKFREQLKALSGIPIGRTAAAAEKADQPVPLISLEPSPAMVTITEENCPEMAPFRAEKQ